MIGFGIKPGPRPHFWRPFPREIADVICGEGDVAALPTHAHEAIEIILPRSRFALTDGAGRALVVSPGDLYITAPFELRGTRTLDGGACDARLLLIGPAMLSALGGPASARWLRTPAGHRHWVVNDPSLYAELWTLVGELRGPVASSAYGARLRGCVDNLLATLDAPPTAKTVSERRPQADGVHRVSDYLHEHIADAVSLDDLARVAGLSKFYLLRAFRRTHGVTPHAYQMQLRLAHAWRLIVDGEPLSRTTYTAGFADQSHLTRRFAEAFGLPPGRYARQLMLLPDAPALALAS
jgi:AraC-like DNA-binding protein